MTNNITVGPDHLFLTGVAQFNRAEYFAAHETWEAVWKSCQTPDRAFFKGLIQAAAALHHWRNGNRAGARNVAGRAKRHMGGYGGWCRGLDIVAFWGQMDRCLLGPDETSRAAHDSPAPERLPTIALVPTAEAEG